jgi:hypothetical protein
MAPEGGSSFRQKTRFAKFTNVPEMLRMWHVSADIKTGEDLRLPTPALARRRADGQRAPETVIVEPCDALLDYVAELGERADKIRSRVVSPEEDNMLKVSGDGRKAALDLRLIGQSATVPGKIGAAAARIAAIWHAHRDHVYQAVQPVTCRMGRWISLGAISQSVIPLPAEGNSGPFGGIGNRGARREATTLHAAATRRPNST